MSVENRRQEEDFERFLKYQEAQRTQREGTLGGVATVLFLATIDLGINTVGEPAIEALHTPPTGEIDQTAEVIDLSEVRRKKLGLKALTSPELGYADAAA